MARPKKETSSLQTEKVVVYVTPDTKRDVKMAANEYQSSESKIGDQAIQFWLQQKGGSSVAYGQTRNIGNLTGPLHGADILRENSGEIDFEWLLKETSQTFVDAVRGDYEERKLNSDFHCDVIQWKTKLDNSQGWIIVRIQDFISSHFHRYYIDAGTFENIIINQEWYEDVVSPFMGALAAERSRRGY